MFLNQNTTERLGQIRRRTIHRCGTAATLAGLTTARRHRCGARQRSGCCRCRHSARRLSRQQRSAASPYRAGEHSPGCDDVGQCTSFSEAMQAAALSSWIDMSSCPVLQPACGADAVSGGAGPGGARQPAAAVAARRPRRGAGGRHQRCRAPPGKPLNSFSHGSYVTSVVQAVELRGHLAGSIHQDSSKCRSNSCFSSFTAVLARGGRRRTHDHVPRGFITRRRRQQRAAHGVARHGRRRACRRDCGAGGSWRPHLLRGAVT